MNIHSEIVDCTEDAYPPGGRRPPTLRDLGTERILNRRIMTWSELGSYGMGGPGFFGIFT